MSDTTQPTTSIPRDVLIFVAGVGRSDSMKVAHVAQLLSWELNQVASDRTETFTVAPTSVGGEVVHRIERRGGAGTTSAVLDIQGYDTVGELDKNKTSGNPLSRVLTLSLTTVAAVAVFFRVILDGRRRAKTRRQLCQALALLLIVLCIVVYLGIALIALVEAIVRLLQGESAESILNWPQWIVLIGAVVGGLVPAVREQINELGERSVQLARYCHTGTLRHRFSGGLQDLIDRVAQRPDVERIHIVGYSFGALIAMDTLYPHGARPGRCLELVDTFVTIGSPFDLVRMVRPNYGEERTITPEINPTWINIYQPIDVLGSNFRDGDEVGEAKVGLTSAESGAGTRVPGDNLAWNPDLKLGVINFLMLRSVTVHAAYWDDNPTARSALGLVAAELLERQPVAFSGSGGAGAIRDGRTAAIGEGAGHGI